MKVNNGFNRSLLLSLFEHEIKSIQSQEASTKLGMATSSIATSATTLIEKDYLEQDATGSYLVINPLLLTVLRGAED